MKYEKLTKTNITTVLKDNNITYKGYGNKKDAVNFIYNSFVSAKRIKCDYVSIFSGNGFRVDSRYCKLEKVVNFKVVQTFEFREL